MLLFRRRTDGTYACEFEGVTRLLAVLRKGSALDPHRNTVVTCWHVEGPLVIEGTWRFTLKEAQELVRRRVSNVVDAAIEGIGPYLKRTH